ncbi:SAM-dependent methyltransferase [Paenibacillus sp. 598K]|nr:class I SAM-dependent methyltransferase [Paenibacillus sp. 598K]GBF75853.1 SAM-dependent methyltransferase [Paenibacillus sp. 598K]
MTTMNIHSPLLSYLERFRQASASASHDPAREDMLQRLLDGFADFVTRAEHRHAWQALEPGQLAQLQPSILELREVSARCVAELEKIRARKLLQGGDAKRDYFANIEASIEEEFGRFARSPISEVVLVGSGAFPMTPLLIARRTGARVVGIDIDGESVELGRQIIARLGPELPIRLEHTTLDRLESIGEASHIIFSSTVAVKYELLDGLHSVAHPDAVVIMRFGDGLKSAFNYPMEQTDASKWQLVETTARPEHVFDVALYRRAVVSAIAGDRASR